MYTDLYDGACVNGKTKFRCFPGKRQKKYSTGFQVFQKLQNQHIFFCRSHLYHGRFGPFGKVSQLNLHTYVCVNFINNSRAILASTATVQVQSKLHHVVRRAGEVGQNLYIVYGPDILVRSLVLFLDPTYSRIRYSRLRRQWHRD